jgi:glycine/D-amino acid oxidase-like deaminating enzyme
VSGLPSGEVWSATAGGLPDRPPLDGDARADVCVVGSGVAGLTCAYLLVGAGRSVVVLDDGPWGGGASAFTTAHLSPVLGHRYCEFEHLHGEEGARLIAASHRAAIDRIEALVIDERLDCDFARLPGFLFQARGAGTELLGRELAAARRAGLDVEWEERAPCMAFDSGPCLRFERQGQLHPLRYLAGLARLVEERGGLLFGRTRVDSIEDGTPVRVRANGQRVEAQSVIVTTSPPRDRHDRSGLHGRLTAYTTCVLGALLPPGALERGLYWHADFHPAHSLRLLSVPEGTLLLVCGEGHRSGPAHDLAGRHRRLEAWTRARFPMLGPLRHEWVGEVLESDDGLAFIGLNPGDEHTYVAAGDSGHGLTQGTIAGMLLAVLLTGEEHPWAALYDPARQPVHAAGSVVAEVLRTCVRSRDWLRGAASSRWRLPRLTPGAA